MILFSYFIPKLIEVEEYYHTITMLKYILYW